MTWTDERRAAWAVSMRERWQDPNYRAKHGAGLRAHYANHAQWNKGRPLTTEERAKVSAGLMGHEVSVETRAKLSAILTGRKMTAEQCAKISAAQKGKSKPPEFGAKISAAQKGKPKSPEHRAKIVANLAKVRPWDTNNVPSKGVCVYCGANATQMDHDVPIQRGGSRDKRNRVPACRSCNASKGQLTGDEFRAVLVFRAQSS